MKTYCDAVESLKIKAILVGLQTLSDLKIVTEVYISEELSVKVGRSS